MLRLSSVFLYLCSLFMLNLFLACQGGLEWEVSKNAIAKMELSFFCAAVFIVLSIISFLFGIKQYKRIESDFKHIFILWYIMVIIMFFIVFIKGGPIDSFRIYSIDKQSINGIFIISITLCTVLFIALFRVSKKKNI